MYACKCACLCACLSVSMGRSGQACMWKTAKEKEERIGAVQSTGCEKLHCQCCQSDDFMWIMECPSQRACVGLKTNKTDKGVLLLQ